jgi:hypothetical protein
MGDIFWDSITEDKINIIENLKKFCSIFNLECPEVNTKMRIDVLRKIANDTRQKFWDSYKKNKEGRR